MVVVGLVSVPVVVLVTTLAASTVTSSSTNQFVAEPATTTASNLMSPRFCAGGRQVKVACPWNTFKRLFVCVITASGDVLSHGAGFATPGLYGARRKQG